MGSLSQAPTKHNDNDLCTATVSESKNSFLKMNIFHKYKFFPREQKNYNENMRCQKYEKVPIEASI